MKYFPGILMYKLIDINEVYTRYPTTPIYHVCYMGVAPKAKSVHLIYWKLTLGIHFV